MQRLSAVILSAFWLFFAVAVLWHTQIAPQPFPFTHIDEQAHYAYTMDLIRNHHWWPDFNHFMMVHPSTGEPTAEPNYINHPPQFYWLMKVVQLAFPTIDPVRYRIVPLIFYLAAFGIYARMGWLLKLDPIPALIYVLLPMLLYAPTQSGYYNNDGLAICGGMLACLGSFYWFAGHELRRAFLCLGFGLALSSVKLTAFLLVGFYVLFTALQRRDQWKKLPRAALPFGLALALVLALPFAYFLLHDGSPAPNFIGQDYLMRHNAAQWGWTPQPDANFLHFLLLALPRFADQFSMPEWTFVPLFWLIASYVLVLYKAPPEPYASLARTALFATIPVFAIHMTFAYGRYKQYGWLLDMFVRYYFPLLPAYGAAAVAGYLALKRR